MSYLLQDEGHLRLVPVVESILSHVICYSSPWRQPHCMVGEFMCDKGHRNKAKKVLSSLWKKMWILYCRHKFFGKPDASRGQRRSLVLVSLVMFQKNFTIYGLEICRLLTSRCYDSSISYVEVPKVHKTYTNISPTSSQNTIQLPLL